MQEQQLIPASPSLHGNAGCSVNDVQQTPRVITDSDLRPRTVASSPCVPANAANCANAANSADAANAAKTANSANSANAANSASAANSANAANSADAANTANAAKTANVKAHVSVFIMAMTVLTSVDRLVSKYD